MAEPNGSGMCFIAYLDAMISSVAFRIKFLVNFLWGDAQLYLELPVDLHVERMPGEPDLIPYIIESKPPVPWTSKSLAPNLELSKPIMNYGVRL